MKCDNNYLVVNLVCFPQVFKCSLCSEPCKTLNAVKNHKRSHHKVHLYLQTISPFDVISQDQDLDLDGENNEVPSSPMTSPAPLPPNLVE